MHTPSTGDVSQWPSAAEWFQNKNGYSVEVLDLHRARSPCLVWRRRQSIEYRLARLRERAIGSGAYRVLYSVRRVRFKPAFCVAFSRLPSPPLSSPLQSSPLIPLSSALIQSLPSQTRRWAEVSLCRVTNVFKRLFCAVSSRIISVNCVLRMLL